MKLNKKRSLDKSRNQALREREMIWWLDDIKILMSFQ